MWITFQSLNFRLLNILTLQSNPEAVGRLLTESDDNVSGLSLPPEIDILSGFNHCFTTSPKSATGG